MHLQTLVFFGFVCPGVPWAQADDALPGEDYAQRLARLLPSSARSAEEVQGVHVAWDGERKRPERWVVVDASVVSGHDASPGRSPHDMSAPPEWTAGLRAFCEVLGIPWQEPGWCMTQRVT